MMTPITITTAPYLFGGLVSMVSFLLGGVDEVFSLSSYPTQHSNNYEYISNHLINVQMDQDQ